MASHRCFESKRNRWNNKGNKDQHKQWILKESISTCIFAQNINIVEGERVKSSVNKDVNVEDNPSSKQTLHSLLMSNVIGSKNKDAKRESNRPVFALFDTCQFGVLPTLRTRNVFPKNRFPKIYFKLDMCNNKIDHIFMCLYILILK